MGHFIWKYAILYLLFYSALLNNKIFFIGSICGKKYCTWAKFVKLINSIKLLKRNIKREIKKNIRGIFFLVLEIV